MADEMIGGTGAAPSTSGPTGGGGQSAPSTPITLQEDSAFIPPGGKEPVRYSDFIKGYVPQSEFTKLRQKDAEERKQWEARIQQAEQALLERARQFEQQSKAGKEADVLSQLREQPYVDGQTAAQLIENIQQQQIAPLVQALQQRDQALGIMWKKLQQMEQGFTGIQSRFGDSALQDRIGKVSASLGIPENLRGKASELLADLYSAYEGDDLEQAFPEIAQRRMNEMRELVREWDKVEQRKAREQLFPGRGASAVPGGPARQRFESPDEIASRLWGALKEPGT